MNGEKENLNGWSIWSKYVLKELERLNDCYDKLDGKIDNIIEDIIMLKVKAGIWGLFGGAIPVIIGLIIMLLKKG